jgi:hypothetical protein
MTSYLTSPAAVRALSEGRGPKKVLLTVPYLNAPYRAPRAQAAVEEDLPVFKARATACCPMTNREVLAGWVEAFHQAIGSREFRPSELGDFLVRLGWAAKNIEAGRAQLLRRLYFSGKVEQVVAGHGKAEGVWKFSGGGR